MLIVFKLQEKIQICKVFDSANAVCTHCDFCDLKHDLHRKQ